MHATPSSIAGALLLSAVAGNALAATATGFGPAAWGAADATLGIEGFVIEDFEDTALAPGLQVQVIPPSLPGYGPVTTLPFTFDPGPDDTFGTAFDTGIWDGSHGLINRPFVPITSYSNDGGWSDVAFLFPVGVKSVGFSYQNADAGIELSLDLGGGFEVFADSTDFLPAGGGRNGYLRIDAAPGEVIHGLLLDNQAGDLDGIHYDHLAFQPVPLPAAAWLFGAALAGLAVVAPRRRAKPG